MQRSITISEEYGLYRVSIQGRTFTGRTLMDAFARAYHVISIPKGLSGSALADAAVVVEGLLPPAPPGNDGVESA